MKLHFKPLYPKRSELKVALYKSPQTWLGKIATAIFILFSLWITLMFFTLFLILIGVVFAVLFLRLALVLKKTGDSHSYSFDINKIEYKKTRQPIPNLKNNE